MDNTNKTPEQKLREAWAKASGNARLTVCDGWTGEADTLGCAVRAFCESEPVAPAVVEPPALAKVREAWGALPEIQREQDLIEWRRDYAFGQSPAYFKFRKALADILESAPVPGDEIARLKADLAEARAVLESQRNALGSAMDTFRIPGDERDKLREELRMVKANRDAFRAETIKLAQECEQMRAKLAAAEKERDEAWRVARRERDQLHASLTQQIADLTRALEAEKKAHNEALARESKPAVNPPARVIECWVAEFDSGIMSLGIDSAMTALCLRGVVRAHRIALPIIETVERGA